MGIEIYKGRPIIYGIGNFVAHSEFMSNVPYDSYEAGAMIPNGCRSWGRTCIHCTQAWTVPPKPGGHRR